MNRDQTLATALVFLFTTSIVVGAIGFLKSNQEYKEKFNAHNRNRT